MNKETSEIEEIQAIAREVESHGIEMSRLNWVHFTTGFDFGIEDAYKKLTMVTRDKAKYEKLLKYQQMELSPLNQRRVDNLVRQFKPYHVSQELNELDLRIQKKVNELSHIINTFRYTLNGKVISSTEIGRILSSEPDREKRRDVFLVGLQLNKPLVDAGFIDLITMRKEYAVMYGSPNFVAYSLEMQEFPENLCSDWSQQVRDSIPEMKEAGAEIGLKFIDDRTIEPWDGSYIASKITPELSTMVDMTSFFEPLNNLFQKFGFDLNNYNITYDIFPRKNKSEWGYNFPIQMGVDSRILANVENRYYEYGILLHESGHAVHAANTSSEDFLMSIGINSSVAEGIANFFRVFSNEMNFMVIFSKKIRVKSNRIL